MALADIYEWGIIRGLLCMGERGRGRWKGVGRGEVSKGWARDGKETG